MALIQSQTYKAVIDGQWTVVEEDGCKHLTGPNEETVTIARQVMPTSNHSAYDHSADMADLRRLLIHHMNEIALNPQLKEITPLFRADEGGTTRYECLHQLRDGTLKCLQIGLIGPDTAVLVTYCGHPRLEESLDAVRRMTHSMDWIRMSGE